MWLEDSNVLFISLDIIKVTCLELNLEGNSAARGGVFLTLGFGFGLVGCFFFGGALMLLHTEIKRRM